MMTLFGGNFWLVGLAYLVAGMALIYALQLQLSMRPGGKPVRGLPMWREPLPADIATALQQHAPPLLGTGPSKEKPGFGFTTTVTPEGDGSQQLFVHVRARGSRGAPTPYNATIQLGSTPPRIAYRLSPLAPLVYIGLVGLVFMLFENPLIGILFALLVAILFASTLYQSRQFMLAGLRVPLAPLPDETPAETPTDTEPTQL